MRVTAPTLRENLYRILDQAIETGETVEVVRKGSILRIVPEKPVSNLAKLEKMKKRDVFVGDPDDLLGMDWSIYWSEYETKEDTK